MLRFFKYKVIKFLEKIPVVQLLIYNNLRYFKFLFPHDKDYYALKLLFDLNEKKTFVDVGGNIGLSTIGFRELGYTSNNIYVFEPDKKLYDRYLLDIKAYYNNIFLFNFGLSYKNEQKFLFQAYYKGLFLHFNNSFSLDYIKKKIKENYPNKYNKFSYKKKKFTLKKFDNLKIDKQICFIKIDVEGLDHIVIKSMYKTIKKQKPVILVEFNNSNFHLIYKLLKPYYDGFFYMLETNSLDKLKNFELKKLFLNQSPDALYSKNSFNIFFIPKNFQFLY
jgi:FkbM family methyltransferase